MTPATSPKARTPRVRVSDYDQRSELVAARFLPLVVGLSVVTCWRKRRAGTFPSPIRISEGRVAWRRSDLENWLNTQVTA